MLSIIVLVLLVLTVFGYIQIQLPGFDVLKQTVMIINGQTITWLNLIVLGVILWALGILPSPFREIAVGLMILWLLSVFGIIAIVWSGHFILLAMVVLLFLAIVMGG